MSITIESLQLSPEQLEYCRVQVRTLAFKKWQEAGCLAGRAVNYWLEAEAEWIGSCYVPDRPYDGKRPNTAQQGPDEALSRDA